MNPSISITPATPHIGVSGTTAAFDEFWDSGMFWDAGGFWDSQIYRGLPSLAVSNLTPSIAVT